MRAKLFFAFVFFLFTFAVKSAFAVSVSITSYPPSINEDPFTLTASVSGATSGTNYLRVDIFKEGTDNYFGETNGSNGWYSGSSYTQYLPITIQSGVPWSGDIAGKVGSPSLSEYDGTGTYKIRIRRYTESGGTNATEANNSSVIVSINIPTPTSIPKTPTPTPKVTPTSTPVPPTPTQGTAKLSPVVLKPTSKTVSKAKEDVLGDKTNEPTKTAEPTIEVLSDSQNPKTADTNIIAKLFISIGLVFLILCGIVISYPYIKKIKDKNNNE